jgi:hypothetical protein
MHDGVIFVDALSAIFLWSKGAERLTGVSAAAASGRHFTPGLLDMCNTAGRRVRDEACPVARALASGAQLRQRLEILGRQGSHVAIDLHAIPVLTPDGDLLGATVVLHDAEPEASLEEKCEALHAEVTKDPMTKVANRAEFDRMQALFMEAHQQAGLPCSLIMTDIDHFKQIRRSSPNWRLSVPALRQQASSSIRCQWACPPTLKRRSKRAPPSSASALRSSVRELPRSGVGDAARHVIVTRFTEC